MWRGKGRKREEKGGIGLGKEREKRLDK